MKLTLHIWRQKGPNDKGQMVKYDVDSVLEDMSFLEMLDLLNERLILEGKEAIAFDHDCREGICGACSLAVNGVPHGHEKQTTVCQLHMRKFKDGDTIYIEPFRAKAFPIIKDLVVDRSAFDRIMQAGGFISVNTGAPQDANDIPVAKNISDLSMDAAACIGCGACVAGCPNGAAMLFTSANMMKLSLLPQGDPERKRRAVTMVNQMHEEGFGGCTNIYECEAVCHKGISVRFISMMYRNNLIAELSKTED
jgi:succinate dehydrogenase / fumarate reductase iron-sulfur subunit